MKVVFFGSSDFSIPVLQALIHARHDIVLVVTTPPKKKGRGQKISGTIVEDFASSNQIRSVAPNNLKSEDFSQTLKSAHCDCLVVASYGKILPSNILRIPSKLPLNVHPSLLPKYRGAAPIAYQLLNGENVGGVTIAVVTEQLDAGDILIQKKIPIEINDNAVSLSEKLADLGGDLTLRALEQIQKNHVQLTPQENSKATYASKLSKNMGRIDWTASAINIHNQIRAFVPWPSAYTHWQEKVVKILKSELLEVDSQTHEKAGTVLSADKKGFVSVQTGKGSLRLLSVQPESKKPMTAYEFSLGYQVRVGDSFG